MNVYFLKAAVETVVLYSTIYYRPSLIQTAAREFPTTANNLKSDLENLTSAWAF